MSDRNNIFEFAWPQEASEGDECILDWTVALPLAPDDYSDPLETRSLHYPFQTQPSIQVAYPDNRFEIRAPRGSRVRGVFYRRTPDGDISEAHTLSFTVDRRIPHAPGAPAMVRVDSTLESVLRTAH